MAGRPESSPAAARCGRTCGCVEPCDYAERRAEERANEFDGWAREDLDRMADFAAAREFGGGR